MKNSDIEKKLREEAREHVVPDVYDNVLSAADAEGLFKGETVVKKPFRGIYLRIAALAACACVCLAVVLPVVLKLSSGTKEPVATVRPVELSVNEAYSFGALTSARLLSSYVAAPSLSGVSLARTAVSASSVTDGRVMEQIGRFNEYFSAMECYLGGEVLNTYAVENTDGGVYAEYGVKMTVSGTDFYGNEVIHVMYYTETLIKSENKRDETKEEYALKGVMIVDGADYVLQGKREYEADGKENENELEIRAYSADAPDTYVEMKHESSEGKDESECEYVYSIYKGGKLVEETAIEFESEKKGDKEEISYELEFRSGESKGKYKLEKEVKNGKCEIKAKYEIDGESGTFTINSTSDGGTEYLFSDGTVKKYF